jgi:glucose-6-phosphate isomerase
VLAELGRLRSGQVWADASASETVRFLDLAYPARDLQPQALLDEIDAWGRSLRDRGDVQTLLYIGFGGSALGPRLLSEVFAEEGGRERIRVEVLDSIDPDTVTGLLQRLDLSTTHFLVCSKSSVTYEAVALYRIFLDALYRQKLDPVDRLTFVVGPTGYLRDEAARLGAQVFPVPLGIGGRWSVLSPVGLTVAAALGRDLGALLEGARVADQAGEEAAQLAVHLAHSGVFVPFIYEDRLVGLGSWLTQLIMESLGKGRAQGRKAVIQSPAVVCARGTADQHSILQDLAEGPGDRLPFFIEVGGDEFSSLKIPVLRGDSAGSPPIPEGTTLGGLRNTFAASTRQCLEDLGGSVGHLVYERVDECSLGASLFFFQMAVAMAAGLLEVNAFDQPGVEAPKKRVRQQFSS